VYVPEIPGLSRAYDLKPSRYGLPYENVPLVAKDGTNVHGWLIRPQGIPHNPGGLPHGKDTFLYSHLGLGSFATECIAFGSAWGFSLRREPLPHGRGLTGSPI
jgi:hypothetical protein